MQAEVDSLDVRQKRASWVGPWEAGAVCDGGTLTTVIYSSYSYHLHACVFFTSRKSVNLATVQSGSLFVSTAYTCISGLPQWRRDGLPGDMLAILAFMFANCKIWSCTCRLPSIPSVANSGFNQAESMSSVC